MEDTIRKRGRPKKIKNKLTSLEVNPTDNSPTIPTIPDIDRVNNLSQKESAMAEAGVTRLKTYRAINNLLTATKTVETTVDGCVIKTEIPDVTANAKGAELALKAFNDSKELQNVVGGVTHNKVVYQWLNVNNVEHIPARVVDE